MADDLFRRLREAARAEEDPIDHPRWLALAHGDLVGDELADLATEAATSPAAAQRLEALRPLGDEFHARVVAEIRAQQQAERTVRPRGLGSGAKRLLLMAAVMAIAVAAMWPLLRSQTVSLPAYELAEFDGYRRAARGVDKPALEIPKLYDALSTLRIVLAPEVSIQPVDRVEVRLYLESGGEIRVLDGLEVEVAEQGGIDIEGIVGRDFAAPPGIWQLVVVVGRVDCMPSMRALREALSAGSLPPGALWQLIVEKVAF